MRDILNEIKGKIIVSCQGNKEDGNPFHRPEDMLQMAIAAKRGGAVGFRANLPRNIKAIKEKYPSMPMIGIYKIVEGDSEVYITPNMDAVDELVSLNCEIIAMDGTDRKNYSGMYAWELITKVKEKYPDQLIMADIATITDAKKSANAGADILGTTLSGYTEESKEYAKKANFDLIKAIKKENMQKFIVAEGKLWTIEDIKYAFDCGADAVVVGTAITNPMAITKRYIENIQK